MNIVIERNPVSKNMRKGRNSLNGKAGRLARMFAKSRQKKSNGKPDRIKTALVMLPIPSKSQLKKRRLNFKPSNRITTKAKSA
ncbi:Uncharacterised protein [Avibacterium paragallinarum]|uniref:Uncharacterized protein n=2 Tax=Avibacterium paragallinarum TaxID=728 RepID=A0A380X625_AVIPA|nr:Uncharacterised protein [Avibacterium paragallinarum]